MTNSGLPLSFIVLLSSIMGFYYRSSKTVSITVKNCIISNVYEQSNSRLTIMLILYLLLTILCVVKLVKFEKGPLVRRL